MKNTIKKALLASTFICLSLSGGTALAAPQAPQAPQEQQAPEKNDNVAQPPSGPPEADVNIKANGNAKKVIEKVEVDTPASVTGEKMQGNGTVVDFTTSGSKAFYTIVDGDHNTFYLVIDLDKTDNNVYFLSDIDKDTLSGDLKRSQEQAAPTPAPVVEPQEQQEPEKQDGNGSFMILVLLLGLGGAVAYYFLVVKRKQKNNDNSEDDENLDDDSEDRFDFEEEENTQK